jgi:hypothetical protein
MRLPARAIQRAHGVTALAVGDEPFTMMLEWERGLLLQSHFLPSFMIFINIPTMASDEEGISKHFIWKQMFRNAVFFVIDFKGIWVCRGLQN